MLNCRPYAGHGHISMLTSGKLTMRGAANSYVFNAVTDKCLHNAHANIESIEKYTYLRTLLKKNPGEFYTCLIQNVDDLAPIIYMPVVGKASKNYNLIVQNNLRVGLTLNIDDHQGRIREVLATWVENNLEEEADIDVVLVTDGERVLGLGDLGANAMGIPVGKMVLYTALGGLPPQHCMAVTLDVGTNNEYFHGKKQSKYVGKQRERIEKTKYDEFVKEFVEAVMDKFGKTTLIQFDGISTPNGYDLLNAYQDKYPVIIDSIQTEATVTVAGVLAAVKMRKTKINIPETKVLIVATGSVYQSALSIGTIMVEANFHSKNIYMMDNNGLLTLQNCPLNSETERQFCHEEETGEDSSSLERIVTWLQPKILIGVSGAKDLFTKDVIKYMKVANGDHCPAIIMVECTTEESYIYAKGMLFSGKHFFEKDSEETSNNQRKIRSAYEKFMKKKASFEVIQCNNNYVYPGVGLGVMLAQMKTVPNKVFAVAAETMASECLYKYNHHKIFYPSYSRWMDCNVSVAAGVLQYAMSADGLTDLKVKAAEIAGWDFEDYKDYVRTKQYKVRRKPILKRLLHNFVKDDCVKGVDSKSESLEKYIYLRKLQATNEKEFYKCIIRNVEKIIPIIYTPGVGKACKNYNVVVEQGGEFGLTLSYKHDKGHILERLRQWKEQHQPVVRAIVVTDGGRVLGLGDLGANGMGIPVGKLALYTALGSVDPRVCLPVTLDVGTNTVEFRDVKTHKYAGQDMDRIAGPEYYAFIDEFMKAVLEVYGRTTLIQFEDFANPVAYPLLERYQHDYTVFNDDIQGTAAAAVAGILAAARFRNTNIDEAKVLFVGAGSAALGIGNLIIQSMTGGDIPENRKKIYMKDAYGLLSSAKCGYPTPFAEKDGRRKFCHYIEVDKNTEDLAKIILWLKPNILIGVSGQPKLFTPDVLRNMAKVNRHIRPIIMPLSNPTTNSECTAEEAYAYAKGCFFASGSPFAPVYVDNAVLEAMGHELEFKEGGKELKPAQCNNDNIFPGVALGIIVAEMLTVPQHVFFIAAETLANKCLQKSDFHRGSLYPEPAHLRLCSIKVAAAVVEYAFTTPGLSALDPKPDGWESWSFNKYEKYVKSKQYHP